MRDRNPLTFLQACQLLTKVGAEPIQTKPEGGGRDLRTLTVTDLSHIQQGC